MNIDEIVQTGRAAATARAPLARSRADVVVGGLPSVSLLPRELRAAARGRTVRHAMIGAVVVAALIAGGSTALANSVAASAQDRADAANAQGQVLLRELAKFKDVQVLQRQLAVGGAAATVGASTEVDWQAQIGAIEQDMPSSYVVQSVQADSASAIAAYPQGTTPLEQPRAASLQLTVKAPTVTELPVWLRKIRSIPAYADATASVSSGDGTGYSVLVTVHLSSKALINAKAAQ